MNHSIAIPQKSPVPQEAKTLNKARAPRSANKQDALSLERDRVRVVKHPANSDSHSAAVIIRTCTLRPEVYCDA